jgi:prepilin-type N-terminal cleavage/methylation domain-containing protein
VDPFAIGLLEPRAQAAPLAMHQRIRHTTRAGFTLIELMASMLIIGILMVFLVPQIPAYLERSKITASKANMAEIYRGMLEYQTKYGGLPNQYSGVRFFACLIFKKVWENTIATNRKLTCPGVDEGALAGIAGREPTEWFIDEAAIDGTFSSYAGRNTQEFALRKPSGKDAWVATDNDPEMNFSTTTLVLMGDGSVMAYELATLAEQGVLAPEEELLIVGPDSPVEELRKLSLD